MSRVRPFLWVSTLNGSWLPCGLFWLLLLPCSFSQNDRLRHQENATLRCYAGSYDNILMTRSRICNVTHNSDSGVPIVTTHCIVFKYNNSGGVSTMFSCDDHHLCDHVQGAAPLYNVTYAGHVGQLLCCEKDNCNDHRLAGPVPPVVTTCYQGTKYNGTVRGTQVTECTLQDGWCVRNTTNVTTPSGLPATTEIYSCQPMDLCDYFNITGSHTICTSNNSSEICCCPENRCFAITGPGAEGDESSSTFATAISSAETNGVAPPHKVQLIRPDMTSLGPNLGSSHQTWFFVGCLLLVFSVFFCLLGTVVMVTVRYRQGRQKQTVTLAYTRIAADSPAGNGDEDIQMLLGTRVYR